MKVELHLHTSAYSACSIVAPRQVLYRLDEEGYDAVFITEHDQVWAAEDLAELQEDFPRLRIFGGIELSLPPDFSQHLLVLGTTDRAYMDPRSPSDVLARARDEGHLTVLAHPFRWEQDSDLLSGDDLPDAIEYRTSNHIPQAAALSKAAAEELNLPMVNSGDVHALHMVGRYWIETQAPLESADQIRPIVLARQYVNRQSVVGEPED